MLNLLTAGLLLTSLVSAQQGGCPMMPAGEMGGSMMMQDMMGPEMKLMMVFHNPGIAEMLGLSDDQGKKLKDLKNDHEDKVLEIRQKIEREELALSRLWDAQDPNQSQIEAKVKTIASLRTDLQLEKVRVFFEIRKILTPEQLEQLQNISMGSGCMGQQRNPSQTTPQEGTPQMHH